MNKSQLNICYLTKKSNAIAEIAKALRPAYPTLSASQAANIEEISSNKHLDLLIADIDFKNISMTQPVLYVIPSKNAEKYINENKCNFITEEELGTHAVVRAIRHLLERERLENELKEASVKDELTGLYNKRFLLDTLSKEVKKASRYHTPLTLLCLGIDGLAEINERNGHAIGDQVIMDMGLIVTNSVRDVDTAGRLGGDEFIAILPETALSDALKVCARIQHAIKNFAFASGAPGINVSVCTGVATLSGQIRTSEALLEAVRTALLGAKKRGRGTSCTWDDAKLIAEPIKENKELITAIQQQVSLLTDETKKLYLNNILKYLEEMPIYKKTLHHTEHVAFYSERLAAKVGMSQEEMATVKRAAILHDMGMLAIDERVILKQGPLSSIEFALIKQHPVIAAQMLNQAMFLKNEVNIVLHHHEWFDGNGYPDHLREKHIPMGSRIITLAEAWDTMITSQAYRDAMSLDVAISELKKWSSKQFDPELVAVFTGLIEG